MQLPTSVLHRLLLGEHIDTQERDLLGISPTTRIKIDELACFLAGTIQTTKRFPPESKKESLSPVYEGIVITKMPDGRYSCVAKRTYADNPNLVAERVETIFNDSLSAAKHSLKWDLALPGTLDGITVK